MGEFDLETVVLDVVRKQTGKPSAGPGSRFAEDLSLSDNGRNALFAFLVQAFSARGVNLPSRGFYLSQFMACETPGEVRSAIQGTLSGVAKKAPAGAARPAPAAPTPPSPAAAPSAAPAAVAAPREERAQAPASKQPAGKPKKPGRPPVGKKASKRKGRR